MALVLAPGVGAAIRAHGVETYPNECCGALYGKDGVVTASYALPYNITAGTLMQFASARPFNAVTGIDNNGDAANNDRPVIDGKVTAKSAFRGTGTQDVGLFVEGGK